MGCITISTDLPPIHTRYVTYGRVQINEDGSGDVFAVASLREEGLGRATFSDISRVGIGATVSLEAVLEQVPGQFVSMRVRRIRVGVGDVQLPGAVAELDTAAT